MSHLSTHLDFSIGTWSPYVAYNFHYKTSGKWEICLWKIFMLFSITCCAFNSKLKSENKQIQKMHVLFYWTNTNIYNTLYLQIYHIHLHSLLNLAHFFNLTNLIYIHKLQTKNSHSGNWNDILYLIRMSMLPFLTNKWYHKCINQAYNTESL